MTKNRLEAFCDAVIAIIITIMVLELKIPHDPSWEAIKALSIWESIGGIIITSCIPLKK